MESQSRNSQSEADEEFLRPEAKRTKWQDLYRPEKEAVHRLLLRLARGVHEVTDQASGRRQSEKTEEHRVATSFLVTGERGAGKTTVMLSAAYATESPSQFLSGALEEPPKTPENQAQAALQRQDRREWEELADIRERTETRERKGCLVDSIQWLEPLDMEFLPQEANLLTTLLVRVRDALSRAVRVVDDEREKPDYEFPERARRYDVERSRTQSPPPALLEEGRGLYGAWEELDELVKKATLMWDGAPTENDARKHVLTQIDAAQTFVDIQERLRDTLSRATAQLGRHIGNKSLVVVLPIDNVDRNARHVHQILKLVRMVYCPTLWYVIAGTERDLGLFLESSHRAELSKAVGSSESAATREKLFSAARRQAKSTLHTALPPSHRVVIENVCANEALDFRIGATSTALSSYLSQLTVDWPSDGLPRKGAEVDHLHPKTLLDLMAPAIEGGESGTTDGKRPRLFSQEVYEKLEEAQRSCQQEQAGRPRRAPSAPLLTQAGSNALSLPIRNLVDLWQVAKRCCHEQRKTQQLGGAPDREQAIELAAKALRRAAEESDLPESARNYLCEQIVYRNESGELCLDCRHNPLRWGLRFGVRNVIDLPSPSSKTLLFSRLVLHDFYGYTIEVKDPDKPDKPEQWIELDALVSGWLMLLHDLLSRRSGARVAVTKATQRFDEDPVLLQTQHHALLADDQCFKVKLGWTMPVFETFFDFERIRLQWRAFVEALLPFKSGRDRDVPPHMVRFIMTAWIDCVLSVAVPEVVSAKGQHVTASVESQTSGPQKPWRWPQVAETARITEEHVDDYAREVSKRVEGAYDRATSRNTEAETCGRYDAVRRWLESGVLLLQLPEYLPGIEPPCFGVGETRPTSSAEPGRSLSDYWRKNRRYLAWKRYEAVRDAVTETDAYHRMTQPQQISSALDLQQNASRRWFEAAHEVTRDAEQNGHRVYHPSADNDFPDPLKELFGLDPRKELSRLDDERPTAATGGGPRKASTVTSGARRSS